MGTRASSRIYARYCWERGALAGTGRDRGHQNRPRWTGDLSRTGQIVVYVLCDIRRAKLGVRDLVTGLEQAIIAFLSEFGLVAEADPKAPGVYVSGEKIASLGLKLVEDLAITVSRLM